MAAEHRSHDGEKPLGVERAVEPQGDDLGHRGIGVGTELRGEPDLGLPVGQRPFCPAIRHRQSRRWVRLRPAHPRGCEGQRERAKLLLHHAAHGIELMSEDLLQFLRRRRGEGDDRPPLPARTGRGVTGRDRLENSLAVDAGHPDPRLAVRLIDGGRASRTGRQPRRRVGTGRSRRSGVR
ncbi:hypothetical protein BK022_27000 [Methylorubrum extorquens]|uniref:Uncharacterized protein n=1 Tax=Methylorubrum extorquens TaxID=408 RepID=A0A1S1NL18_METEX|nr:hypothetical protein BK022_27000 [Methylorubrum extorquens]